MHGDRIIVAARLMQLAAKLGGMVLCDETTHGATRDEIRFVRLRPVQLKGRDGTMQPYRCELKAHCVTIRMLTCRLRVD